MLRGTDWLKLGSEYMREIRGDEFKPARGEDARPGRGEDARGDVEGGEDARSTAPEKDLDK